MYIYNHLIKRKEVLGARGGAGGSCMLADLLWHVVVKICIDMRENHMNMEEIFLKKNVWDDAFGSLELCSRRLVNVCKKGHQVEVSHAMMQ
jgi:hypothetical protein